VAIEAFAAAKAGRSFCSFSGTTEVMPCYKAPLKRVFAQAVKPCPVTKTFDAIQQTLFKTQSLGSDSAARMKSRIDAELFMQPVYGPAVAK
jgi:hypothetical protein